MHSIKCIEYTVKCIDVLESHAECVVKTNINVTGTYVGGFALQIKVLNHFVSAILNLIGAFKMLNIAKCSLTNKLICKVTTLYAENPWLHGVF